MGIIYQSPQGDSLLSINHLKHRIVGALICASLAAVSPVSHAQTSATTSTVGSPSALSAKPHKTASDLLQSRLDLGDGRELWHPTLAQLGFTLAPGVNPAESAAQARLISDKVRTIAYFTGIAEYVDRSPVSARPVALGKAARNSIAIRSASQPIPAKILPGQDGAKLLVEQAADCVIAAVIANPNVTHIVLPVRTDPSRVNDQYLTGIDARIAHFVTHFNPREVGRTRTVRRAIALVNNNIIAPGQVFSLNDVVGERTQARGFGVGHVFVDKKMKMEVGGGMCQVATTLFNAALLADMEIVERHQHVRTVPYVKAGSDATVWWGKKDLKIRNNTLTPIYISYQTKGTHAICDLFGKAQTDTKVEVVAYQRRNAARDYFGSIIRYTTVEGKRTKTYQAFSRYKWTAALDFTR